MATEFINLALAVTALSVYNFWIFFKQFFHQSRHEFGKIRYLAPKDKAMTNIETEDQSRKVK
jgi:hypothetical protein